MIVLCKNCKWRPGKYNREFDCQHFICFKDGTMNPLTGEIPKIRTAKCYVKDKGIDKLSRIIGLNNNYDCKYFEEKVNIWKSLKKMLKMEN